MVTLRFDGVGPCSHLTLVDAGGHFQAPRVVFRCHLSLMDTTGGHFGVLGF
jgi:hypothetical protein